MGARLSQAEHQAEAQRVVFVNMKEPRSWEASNNGVIAEGVTRYDNAVLADWYAATVGHPEWFWDDDKIHPGPEGTRVYVGLIVSALQAP
jgi:hypothetical protein